MFSLDLFADQPAPFANRCYFALRPTEEIAGPIEDFARAMKYRLGLEGSVYRADRLHVSLCPVGGHRVLKGDIDAAIDAAASIKFGAFPAWFDTISLFGGPGNRCVVLHGNQASGALLAFHRQLQSALIKSALPPGKWNFHPHITLLRPAPAIDEIRLTRPIEWMVREFVLAQKGKGRALDIGRWPLG